MLLIVTGGACGKINYRSPVIVVTLSLYFYLLNIYNLQKHDTIIGLRCLPPMIGTQKPNQSMEIP